MHSSPEHEEATIRIIADDNDKNAVTILAQKVWKHSFGVVRSSGTKARKPRVDVGSTNKRPSEDTEVGWMRKKHCSRHLGECDIKSVEASVAALPTAWTPEHAKEQLFVEQKLRERKKQACYDNLLVAEERTPELELESQSVLENMASREASRQKKRKQLEKSSVLLGQGNGPSREMLHRKRVWLENQMWRQMLVSNGNEFIHVESIHGAEIFVVNDLAKMPIKVQWVVALTGGYAVTPDFCQF